MTILRVRGPALPHGEVVDLYADEGTWTDDPAPGAELVEGWLLPGLVDAHTHPGSERPGEPLDDKILRADLHRLVDSGVTLIRAPGLAGEPPAWFGRDPDVPRALHAGAWIAQEHGWGRRTAHDEMPALASAQAARTGWAKIIVEGVPAAVLRRIVAEVHAVGGRVAVHSRHKASGTTAVRARVDSIEHGLALDEALLPAMARQATALTPTLSVSAGARHAALVAAAHEAGVTLLAGTDSRLAGAIVGEIRALVAAGVPPHEALAAASWSARHYLGLPGLQPAAPADAVVYGADPRTDLAELDHPRAVILRGVRVR